MRIQPTTYVAVMDSNVRYGVSSGFAENEGEGAPADRRSDGLCGERVKAEDALQRNATRNTSLAAVISTMISQPQ